jgi:hypothetical protein
LIVFSGYLVCLVIVQGDGALAPINILIVVVAGVFEQATEEERTICWSQL